VTSVNESPFPLSCSPQLCNTKDNLKRHQGKCKGTPPPEQSTAAPTNVNERGQVQLGTSQPPSPAPAMPDPSYGTQGGATPHPAQPVHLHDWPSRPSTSSSEYHNAAQHDTSLAYEYQQQQNAAYLNGHLMVSAPVRAYAFQPVVITPDSWPRPQVGNSNASYYGDGNGLGASVYSFGSTMAQHYSTMHGNGPSTGQLFPSEPYNNDNPYYSTPE
jgi:hypothetical protein